MKLINLTPHPVQIWEEQDGKDICILTIPPESPPARCIESRSGLRSFILAEDPKIPNGALVRVDVVPDLSYSKVYDLPEQVFGVCYIVSLLVIQNSPGRKDLLMPYDLVRNEKGSIIGCRRLAQLK
jgi:hypothetical protein